MTDLSFYKDKNVLVTGHTGFKGTWLCHMLVVAGAYVTGYALSPPTDPSVFELSGIEHKIKSITGDVRDLEKLSSVFEKYQPEIVIHLAAQPLVRDSHKNPHYTYETNVMGTVNVLECIRKTDCVKSFLNVTTDKVYDNKEWGRGYKETDPLDGFDPYSNSKSCSELVTHSYKNSFFADGRVAISTARAGNVIGGGDFASDRIIPDCVRAAISSERIIVRNPYSVRPYQHVIDPLYAYLLIVQKQYEDSRFADYYNVGPDESDCLTTGNLATVFCSKWGDNLTWVNIVEKNAPHEAHFLKLDCSKIKSMLGWQAVWNVTLAIEKTVEWTKCYQNRGNISELMTAQISDFLKGQV
jgi:CDP-glucose 4,6-dehydratase